MSAIQRQQFGAAQAAGEMGDTVEGFVVVASRLLITRTEIGTALDGQSLNQQPRRHLLVGRKHESRFQLLGLAHVMLQRIAQ